MNSKTDHPADGNTALATRTITRRIGHTTYKVNVHFSKTSSETISDKIMRLISIEAADTKEAVK